MSTTTRKKQQRAAPLDARFPTVRCSTEALEKIKHKATRAGLSQSDYIRSIALNGKIIIREPKEQAYRVDPAYIEQLRRIGVNLNQMTRRYHERGEIVSDEVEQTLEAINSIMQKVSVR